MTRFEIRYLDDQPQNDEVAFALAPIDSFTGTIVKTAVTARIKATDQRARRNLSGMLVFVNLRDPDSDEDLAGTRFEIEVDARDAGYFNEMVDVAHPSEVALDDELLTIVPLFPKPESAFTNETTLVRGVVLQDGLPVDRATIGAIESETEPDPGDPLPFETRSSSRGAFVLPLRLSARTPGQAGVPSARFWFRFGTEDRPAARQMAKEVTDGKPHRFEKPIDLADGTVIGPDLLPIQVGT